MSDTLVMILPGFLIKTNPGLKRPYTNKNTLIVSHDEVHSQVGIATD